MSIEREYGKFIVVCDLCGITDDGMVYDTFDDAVKCKKANDFKSKNICGEWYDICPDCEQKGGLYG